MLSTQIGDLSNWHEIDQFYYFILKWIMIILQNITKDTMWSVV